MEINLILTLSYSIPDVLCCGGSGACPSPLVRQICNSFYYCKYLSNYFLLNHFTHPHLEINLVLTLSYSIPDVLRRFLVGPAHACTPLVRHILLLSLLLCKYISYYFLLNHFTHPHLEINLVLTLSYSIPDVVSCDGSQFLRSTLKSLRCENGWGLNIKVL